MKTATFRSPASGLMPRFLGSHAGWFALTAAIAGTLAIGLPTSVGAQAEAARTVATGSNIPLAPNAPDRYTVRRGDTLWGIAQLFLRDAWYWPEIWHVNPQVENPHLIYPGDVLTLVYVDGQPRVTLERGTAAVGGDATRLSPQVRSEPLPQAITTVPYEVIAAFMGRPTLLDREQVESGPYLVAMRDGHMIGAAGNEIYARGIGSAAPESRYSVIHVGEPLRDPENRNILGYHGLYVGSGAVLQSGDPAKLVLTDSLREALQGDKLFPEDANIGADFIPHAPAAAISGSVIAVDDYSVVGQYQVVALNRGSRDGLEPGHVLAVHESGGTVKDIYSRGGQTAGLKSGIGGFAKNVRLPDERTGLIMVFKANDRMSYGLVMEAIRPIRTGDVIGQP